MSFSHLILSLPRLQEKWKNRINMRIISGKYGRRRFDVPTNIKARPTTDFARENIFNVLENLIDFKGIEALDLFAGTGAISFELLSRECSRVVCVEIYPTQYNFIRKVQQQLESDSYQGRCVQVRTKLPATIRPHFCRSALRFKGAGINTGTDIQKQSAQRGRPVRIGTWKAKQL